VSQDYEAKRVQLETRVKLVEQAPPATQAALARQVVKEAQALLAQLESVDSPVRQDQAAIQAIRDLQALAEKLAQPDIPGRLDRRASMVRPEARARPDRRE